MLEMDLTVLETKLYHVEGTEEEIKTFSLIKKFSTFQNFYFDPKVLMRVLQTCRGMEEELKRL